jgi:sugar phosphate isomerase/epimerase
MPSVTFGLNTCYAIKRWPEPEAWTAIAARLGVRHVQFSFDLLDPLLNGDPAAYTETRLACEREGIEITSAFTGLIGYSQNSLSHPSEHVRDRAQRWYEAAIDATAILGARGLGGHIGAMSVAQHADATARQLAIDRTVAAVRALAERAAERELGFLLWEIMPVAREYPSRLDETAELVGRLAGTAVPVELCLDLGHMCAHGATGADRDPFAWLERLGAQTRCVHLQQTDGEMDRHWPFTAEFNAQGIVRADHVIDLVAQFDRAEVELMCEPMFAFEAADQDVVDALADCVEFWRPALARVGGGALEPAEAATRPSDSSV